MSASAMMAEAHESYFPRPCVSFRETPATKILKNASAMMHAGGYPERECV